MKKICFAFFVLLTIIILALSISAADIYVVADDQREFKAEDGDF